MNVETIAYDFRGTGGCVRKNRAMSKFVVRHHTGETLVDNEWTSRFLSGLEITWTGITPTHWDNGTLQRVQSGVCGE